MNIITKVETFVKHEVSVVKSALTSPEAHQIEVILDEALNFALPVVESFAATGYAPAAVAVTMAKYAIPVADGLANGSVTAIDEIKSLIGAGVTHLVSKNFGLSTTLAAIINNLAYAKVKPSVIAPAVAPAS